MISLNLVKPISPSLASIARKCKWKNMEDVPVRMGIVSNHSGQKAILEPEPITISTRLNPNNFQVLDIILSNEKLSRNPFVRKNLTEILNASKTEQGSTLMQTILVPETLDKLNYQRALVKNYPRDYVKDKTMVKYLKSPAALNSLFSDISVLKAAYIMDKESLNALFKLDITTGHGKAILDDIGRFNLDQLQRVQKNLKDSKIKSFVISEKAQF